MNDTETTKLIDDYFENRMSRKEKESFIKQKQQNSKLQEEFELQKMVLEVFRIKRQANQKAFLKSLAKKKKANAVWINIRRYAAIFVLFILIPISINYYYSNEYLLDENFEVYEIVEKRSKLLQKEEIISAFDLGIQAYKNKNFNQAIDYFSRVKYDDSKGLYMQSSFFLGNTYLSLKRYPSAIKQFNEVIEKFNYYDDEAQWYLALSYLGNDEQENAVKALEKIIEKDSGYKLQAQKLLNKLNSFWKLFV